MLDRFVPGPRDRDVHRPHRLFLGAAVRPGDAACAGLALEPQAWPDALHQPTFPDIIATPDSPYRQITEWRFSIG